MRPEAPPAWLLVAAIGLGAIGLSAGDRAVAQDVPELPAEVAAAAGEDEGDGGAEAGATQEKPSLLKRLANPDRRFIVVPIPQSNPTIGTGIIIAGAYYYPQGEGDEAAGHPASSTQIGAGHFDTSSWGIVLRHQGYYEQDTWRIGGIGGYMSLNLQFFGIGGEAGDRNQSVGWNLEGFALWPRVLGRVRGDWFLGGDVRFIDSDSGFNVQVAGEKFDRVDQDRLKATSMGLGPRIEYDTRDDQLNPYSGTYGQFASVFNGRAIGSDTTYEIYDVRARRYQPLSENITLALDAKGRFTNGDVPFFDLSRVELRGFSATRYMDNLALQAQAELRWRVHPRFGLTVFGGVGAVAENLSSFESSTAAWAGGLGLRVTVARKRRANLRLDYAFSEDGNSIHLFVGEAF